MRAMRRPLLPASSILLVLLISSAGSSCGWGARPIAGGTHTVAPTASLPSASPPSPTAPPGTPTILPTIDLPNDAPRAYPNDVGVDQVPIADLLPPGAHATGVSRLSASQGSVPEIAAAWTRGSNPFAAEHGLVVWQPFDAGKPWRVVYAFTDGPSSGVLGVRFETGDLTGDGVSDALTFEDTGGSGGCGVWRVVESGTGSASEIFRRGTCDAQVEMGAGALLIREAQYEPGDAHCCPSRFRTTTLRWNGGRWVVVHRTLTRA